MIKKIMIFILSILIYSIAFGESGATTWKFNPPGARYNLMIVYKVVPYASFSVSKPERMRIAANSNQPFTYTESSGQPPLEVKTEVEFRNQTTDADIRQDIVKTVYNQVTYSFQDSKFYLEPEKAAKDDSTTPIKILGEAYFSDAQGNRNSSPEDTRKTVSFSSTLDSGVLKSDSVYINAEFNKDGKIIPMGSYKGKLIVEAQYEGKDPLATPSVGN